MSPCGRFCRRAECKERQSLPLGFQRQAWEARPVWQARVPAGRPGRGQWGHHESEAAASAETLGTKRFQGHGTPAMGATEREQSQPRSGRGDHS